MKLSATKQKGVIMSIDESVERGKTALLEAKMVVHTGSSYSETVWLNSQGQQIAYCLGVPALCPNSPVDKKCHCVHFSFYWRLGQPGWHCMTEEDISANEKMEAWINQQPFIASECVSLGQYLTIGIWHTAKKRWMWGPKQNRH